MLKDLHMGNTMIPEDKRGLIKACAQSETNETAKSALEDIAENFQIGAQFGRPFYVRTPLWL